MPERQEVATSRPRGALIVVIINNIIFAALNIKNLINELNIIVHKWFEFGIQLGIEFHILKSFEMEHSKDPKRCLSEVLQYWLDGKACEKSQVNWETVIEALESPSINEGAIASRLRETIELPYETSEYGSGSASRTTSDVNYDVQLRPRDTGIQTVAQPGVGLVGPGPTNFVLVMLTT